MHTCLLSHTRTRNEEVQQAEDTTLLAHAGVYWCMAGHLQVLCEAVQQAQGQGSTGTGSQGAAPLLLSALCLQYVAALAWELLARSLLASSARVLEVTVAPLCLGTSQL